MKGTLTSKTYGMAAFPPKQFAHGDTGDGSEEGKATIGVLKCKLK